MTLTPGGHGMTRHFFLALMFSVFAANAEEADDASESYICIAEQATGFLFDPSEGRWNSTGFNVEHGRYRLTIYAAPEPLRIGSPEMMHGEVRQVGRDDKRGFFTLCLQDFDENGRITCTDRGNVQKFRMDIRTMRYFLSVGGDSLLSDAAAKSAAGEGVLPAAIEIGYCTRM